MSSSPISRADCRSGLERATAGENRKRLEEPLLARGQQVVAPVDQGGHRLVPRQSAGVSAGEQTEALVEPLGDLARREDLHARGGQLDRQRNAVEPAADLGNIRRVVVASTQSRRRPQAHDRRTARPRHTQYVLRTPARIGWNRKRRQPIDTLARNLQRLSAGRENAHVGARLHECWLRRREPEQSRARSCLRSAGDGAS